jgi:hypothetical protein
VFGLELAVLAEREITAMKVNYRLRSGQEARDA